ncbi:MAG: EI24 domain-containing protein, partial [Burkholderiales bacterium]|nr:EI24 domain-containing protein [Burkholderiales bacterium]
MNEIIGAFVRALRDLPQPRILAVVLLPMAGSIVLWVVLAWIFWDAWTGGIAGAVGSTAVAGWLKGWGVAWVIDSAAVLLVVIAILPATFITALVITEVVAMPVIVGVVAERYHPDLERRASGTLVGSVRNSIVGIIVFAVLWIVTLPLWLTGIGAVLAPVLTSAYLSQRVFRYDALAEHATGAEYVHILRTSRGDLFVLGILLSLLLYVPIVNLLVPVLSGLAFTQFCLGR